MKNRLTLFSMYNDGRYINPNILHYLNELKKRSKKLIVLINHGQIDTKMLKRIQAIAKVEFVENYGYDFGMYNAYFTTHPTDIRTYDQILLCNDSVIIHKPLIDVFQTIDTMNAEYMGINEGYMKQKTIDSYVKASRKLDKKYKSPYKDGRHIESWFLQLQGDAKQLLVDLIREGVPPSKGECIMEYELKRAQIAKQKYTYNYIYKCKADKKIIKDGITLSYDKPLLPLEANSPFIKKDFRNYGYKRQFKPIIDYLCTFIYEQNKINGN